ncbi:MAG: DMT family transporter [Pseudomonadota bacterium]
MKATADTQTGSANFAYALLFFTTLFWSGNAIAGKLAVGHVSPMVLTFLRWAMAFGILLVIGLPQLRAEWKKVRPHLPILLAFGVTGFAGFNITLYSALNHTSAINVTIEQAAIPLLIFIGNFIFFRTKVTVLQMAGFSLTFVGVLVVASNGSLERLAALQFNRGDLLMGIAGILYAGYSIALKYRPDVHWKTFMTVMAFSALMTSIPFALWELNSPQGIAPDRQGWIVAIYTAIFPAIVSQIFYIRGIGLIGPNRAGLFINLIPVMGTLLAVVILGEAFGWHHAMAIVLVVGGITIAESAKGSAA